MTTRHPSSLMNLPLVAQALTDPGVRYIRRGVDARWNYEGEVQTSLTGFNPTTSTVFYRAHSHVDAWMDHKDEDTRAWNYEDGLLGEVMFMLHDYLHVWSCQWIAALCPDIGFGTAPVTAANLEDMTFCHLLTEAVATVGLDYWTVCAMDLNAALDLGTDFTHLTVSYHLKHEDEYRRFAPKFTAQDPAFLATLTRFYCTGEFLGFGKEDLARSPLLLKWLSHELEYGATQREYTRQWLAYLAPESITVPPARLQAKVAMGKRWQRRLVGELSELLWSKVKSGDLEPPTARIDPRRAWRAPTKKPCDFRFLNWNALQRKPRLEKRDLNLAQDTNFLFWFRQFLSQFDYAETAPELVAMKLDLFTKRRRDLCEYLFRDQKRVEPNPREPVDLFLLG